ncbi:MAG: hypothetical protein IPH44_07455 [Myxococcales bacterium]|nr:hypothetical protein [Myxococcales bacterium]
MRPIAFSEIPRVDLDAVTGGLTATIRTRRQAPDVPSAQPSAVDQQLAGLSAALANVGRAPAPAAAAPAASPLAGLLGGGLPIA